jgi:hypothetical protein
VLGWHRHYKWSVPGVDSPDTSHLAIYTSHDNDDPRLSCRHLIPHPVFFLSPLMPPPQRHPILGRGRGSRHFLPIFVRQQSQRRSTQWLLHVHENFSHHARTIVFVIVGCPVRLLGLRPVLRSHAAPAHSRNRDTTDARRRGYGASRSCS